MGELEEIIEILSNLESDNTVPRNIRRGAEESRKILLGKDSPLDLRTASVISILDELANDPNVPPHARTVLWNVMGKLETVK